MINKHKNLILIGIVLATSQLVAQVDLYLEPSEETPPIATVLINDSNLTESFAVLDEESAAQGWVWAEYTRTLTGYVPDTKIGKDLFPVSGASIRLRPETLAPVLTSVEAGDEIQILDTGEWWKVEFTKAVPVYFIDPKFEEQPAVEVEIANKPNEIEIVEADEDLMAILDANIEAGYGPKSTNKSINPAHGLNTQFEGVFKSNRIKLGFIKPKNDFELIDDQGRSIGAINIDSIVIPDTLENYLDLRVIIHGNRSYDQKNKKWIINALNMRIKD